MTSSKTIKKLCGGLFGAFLLFGSLVGLGSTAVKSAVRADAAETKTGSWDLTSTKSDWTATGNVTYFGQPYGYKAANGTLVNKSISDFTTTTGISEIKVGFKCLQNGGATSKLTIYLVNSTGTAIGSGVEVTPVTASAASGTTYQYATFTTNLSGAAGFMMKVTTFGKNILVNGAEYKLTYSAGGGTQAPTLESIAVSGTPTKTTYTAGEPFDPAGLAVTGTYSDKNTAPITEGITWDVTPSTLTAGITSVSVTAKVGDKTSPAYPVNGLTVTAKGYDLLNNALIGITGTTYTDWSKPISDETGATYTGNTAGDKESIQLRSNNNNSGIIVADSVGVVTKVVVEWNSTTASGRTLDIYGKSTKYTATTELYSVNTSGTKLGSIVYGTDTELDFTNDAGKQFEYIGLRSNSGAMYLTSIKIYWAPKQAEVTSVSLTPNDEEVTLVVGQSQEFEVSIKGYHLSEDEEATINFEDLSDAAPCFEVSKSSVKHGEKFTVTATKAEGMATLTVSCGGKTSSEISFYSEAVKELDHIGYSGTYKNSYYEGDSFDNTGVVISAYYVGSDTPKDVTSLVEWPTGVLETSATSVTVSYTEGEVTKTVDIPVSITAKAVQTATWTLNQNFKWNIYEGDSFDFANLGKLEVTWNNGDKETLTAADIKENCTLGLYTKGSNTGTLVDTIDANFKWDAEKHNGKYIWVTYKGDIRRKTTPFNVVDRLNSIKIEGPEEEKNESFEIKNLYSSNTSVDGVTLESTNFNLVFKKNEANTGPQYYTSGTSIRAYAGNTLTVSSSKTLTKIVFGFSTGEGTNEITVSEGKYSDGTWTGSASSVTFTIGGTSGHRRFASVSAYWMGKGADTELANVNFAAQKVVAEFAKYLITETAEQCALGSGYSKTAMDSAWNNVSAKYTALFVNNERELSTDELVFAKNILSKASAKNESESDKLQIALWKYEKIVSDYGQSDFLSGVRGSVATQTFQTLANSDVSVTVIVVIFMTSIAAVGAISLKKKKHN